MSVWSDWRRGEAGRAIRTCISNGLVYTQYDNQNGAVVDQNGNLLNRDAARVLTLPAALMSPTVSAFTPRSAFAARASPPQQTHQLGTVTASSSFNYQHGNSPGPASSGADAQSPPEGDEGKDYLTKLPANRFYLIRSEMAGQPLTGDIRADLQSVKTTGLLPDGYIVRPGTFFVLGTVFQVLWVEPRATTDKDYEADDDVYKTLRPMVVVSKKKSFCICAPVFTYKNQGVAKSGLIESEVQHHAVVHMEGRDPLLTEAETKKWGNKIRVEDAFTVEPPSEPISKSASKQTSKSKSRSISKSVSEARGLVPMSRIRFDKTYPVGYNLKVLEIGRVVKDQRPQLQARWDKANKS